MTPSLGKVIMLNCSLLQSRINRSITFEYNFHHIARCITICFSEHWHFPHLQIQENIVACLSLETQLKRATAFLIKGGCLLYFDIVFISVGTDMNTNTTLPPSRYHTVCSLTTSFTFLHLKMHLNQSHSLSCFLTHKLNFTQTVFNSL